MLRRAECSGFGLLEHGAALVRDPVGALDRAQAGGYPGLAGGDGLAVASAVGAFGEVLAELLDLADGASRSSACAAMAKIAAAITRGELALARYLLELSDAA